MKEKIKMVTTLIAFISLIVVGGVSAASYVTYATVLPRFGADTELASANKATNSQSKVENSVVGQGYKANMWIQQGSKKVSATALNVTDNDTRYFTVDQSAVGKKVSLVAENASFTYVTVDIAGKFYPDK
ncbi:MULTISPECIES: hypothetical protein [Anoxybacillaceae]|uniref:Uncharacterized protein YxeA n=4 Tax=Bacillota TaxID=1239 RepID=A0A846MLS4_9BACL|nr:MULTISPECIES: hypothetical protein [Bacillaceae]MED3664532.1 hypothetical protein [Geobacillus stearothermophilus]MED3730131.1 hypothetical protein [Geobacillus stearothermophilus]NIK16636.1 uncharacterized protein YxeA [Saccharococcus thermophilus]RDV22577.1 hypothetical protein DXK91_07675 [Parageobacillus toebii]